ncbi:hypothetical protein AB0H83_49125, partial [Dactylosporangium sp. NPDC050688]|uniref:hypothetical protein n=1 Tax=Dactylosporangium sp. NPDC050688 TaxID=3157217 RepID=UPI0033F01319
PLPKATLSDLLNAKSTPTRETVIAFLTACGLLDDMAQRPWLDVWERVATAHQPRPDGAVRVREARPRMLGVHAAIQIQDVRGELPPYVPRDLDADLRTAITAAAASGGLVLMIGGSSVGKTRALFEAVQAALPEWWLLHPTDMPTIGAHAAAPTPRTVLWLDELQRYLNHPARLTLGVLHRLITARTAVVATLWPDEYSKRTARPVAGQSDPHADDREILRLAHIVQVPDRFTTTERRRAEALANTDRRLRIALDTTDAGFTQVLAAGPALIQRWETAEDCYGQAVITAALDARRVGAQHPVTRDYLTAATPAYLTPTQQATAPPDWLEQSLAYATTPVHGATGCLNPAPGGMSTIAGWTAADYLHQHARNRRRTDRLPSAVWEALIAHRHPDDTLMLGLGADRRAQYGYAEILLRQAADAGDLVAGIALARILTDANRIDDLRDRAEAGDPNASSAYAHILAQQGELEELRARAGVNAHDFPAASYLADLLAKRGLWEELQSRADAGDDVSAAKLADVLIEQGQTEEALAFLRAEADDAGENLCSQRLVDLLVNLGRPDELRARSNAGDLNATYRLVDLLEDQGDNTEALALLRKMAAAGDEYAAERLPRSLRMLGMAEELRALAQAGDAEAVKQLAILAAGQSDNIAHVGPPQKDEYLEEIYARARAGDEDAACRFATLIVNQHDVDEAITVLGPLADAGSWNAADQLARMLADHNRIDELRKRADNGDDRAAEQLIRILIERGQLRDLEDELAAGTTGAARALRRRAQANRPLPDTN